MCATVSIHCNYRVYTYTCICTTSHVAIQVSDSVFKEVRQLIKTALEVRRKFMDLSLQDYCQTTGHMLDNKLPPSSMFCVPDVLGGAKFTSAGDIMSGGSLFLLVTLRLDIDMCEACVLQLPHSAYVSQSCGMLSHICNYVRQVSA